MTAHIMLDLETLASTEDAAIIQIAAAAQKAGVTL